MIITISRDTYAHGSKIAQKVAERLGAMCLGREVVMAAARNYDVPEDHIHKALHDAPSFLERLSATKQRHVAMFRAALFRSILEQLEHGGVVYHGLAGHFFLAEVPHVLRVRVVADIEERIREEVRREGVDEDTALKYLLQEDEERARWAKHLYGVDYRHPEQYDLCLNLGVLSVDDGVEILTNAAKLPPFGARPAHVRAQVRRLSDLALAAEAEARLLGEFRKVHATSIEGKMHVGVKAPLDHERDVADKVRNRCSSINGTVSVCVNVSEDLE